MNLNDLQHEVEDKAVEYLNVVRLESLEEMALNQLNKSANNGYVRLHKLEFSTLLNAVRGLQRKRQDLEREFETVQRDLRNTRRDYSELRDSFDKLRERTLDCPHCFNAGS